MRRLRLLSLAATVSAGTVSVPFTRSNPNPALSGVAKRDSLSVTAINNITGGGYYADFEVGTPGQKLSFLLDTGSSDTWVNSVDSDLCSSRAEQRRVAYCTSTFNPNDSSTFELVDQNGFNITYLDDRNIQGDYFNDTFTVNGKAIKNQQLGLALETVRPTGIMGLGFSANVASDVKYPTVVDNMVSQGYINTPAYSLYLNDIDSNSGTVLFGGIDKDKFIGNLTTLPLTNAFQDKAGNITSFSVMLKGFQVKTPSGKTDVDIGSLNAVAILDSGSTICLLPDNQVDAIYSEFDVHLVQSVSSPFIDCAYRGDKGKGFTFDFIFEGKTISVPMDEMVINAFDDMQDVISQDPVLGEVVADWDGACLFGIGPASDYGISTDRFALLGDTFLRSAYVVYDLANNQLGLAQANLNSTSSDIVELKAGDKDLPDVEGASRQSGNGDDNAAGHAVPGAAVAVMMAVGAALVVL